MQGKKAIRQFEKRGTTQSAAFDTPAWHKTSDESSPASALSVTPRGGCRTAYLG